MSVVACIFRKAGEVFNFTKDRLRLLVPHGIWEIFTTYISCTHAASYFYYYVISRSFLLDTRAFSLYLFRCRHWELTSGRLFNSISSRSSLFPIFRANTNYIFLNWGCIIYSCLLYSRISVVGVSYLPASSIH